MLPDPGSSPRVCTDVPIFVGSDRFVVSDDRHTWCFNPDGRLLWSTDLVELGALGGPVSTVVTSQGFVGGVTMEGQVVLLDPGSGAPVRPAFDLRAGTGFPPPPPTPGLWAGDMMDADTAALIDGGDVRWRRSFDELAERHLPSRPAAPMFPHPDPIGTVNSVQTVGSGELLVVVALGYGFRHPDSGAGFLQPHRSLLVTVDASDGTVLHEVDLRDTSEAVVVAEPDGTVHVCHAALLTSLAATLDPCLPEHLRTPLRPIGGITTLRPT